VKLKNQVSLLMRAVTENKASKLNKISTHVSLLVPYYVSCILISVMVTASKCGSCSASLESPWLIDTYMCVVILQGV
jgi:hypothetical protein